MTMKTNLRHIFLLLVALCIEGHVNAQIRYDAISGIQIGTNEIDIESSIHTKDILKLHLAGDSYSAFFTIDFYHTFCYLSTINSTVYFYESDTSSYQDVRAYHIRLSANGEIYDSYTEPEDALEVLRKLHPVSYSFKNEAVKAKSAQGESSETHFGFIAQEVKEILPDDVNEDSDGNLSIRYNTFIPIAVNSVKALSDKISRNEERIAELEKSLMK